MVTVKDVTRLTLKDLWQEVNEEEAFPGPGDGEKDKAGGIIAAVGTPGKLIM